MRRLCDDSGTGHGDVAQDELLKLQKRDVLPITVIKEIELGGLLL